MLEICECGHDKPSHIKYDQGDWVYKRCWRCCTQGKYSYGMHSFKPDNLLSLEMAYESRRS